MTPYNNIKNAINTLNSCLFLKQSRSLCKLQSSIEIRGPTNSMTQLSISSALLCKNYSYQNQCISFNLVLVKIVFSVLGNFQALKLPKSLFFANSAMLKLQFWILIKFVRPIFYCWSESYIWNMLSFWSLHLNNSMVVFSFFQVRPHFEIQDFWYSGAM